MLALLAGAGYAFWQRWPLRAMPVERPLTAQVTQATLRITVVERGALESTVTVDGICEVPGYENKIIFIVPEGTLVKPGDVVVRFDTARIDKDLAQQEITITETTAKLQAAEQSLAVQINKSESEVAAAELELTLARLDLTKYEEGDHRVEMADQSGKIAQARIDLEKSKQELDDLRVLVKKGYRKRAELQRKEDEVRKTEFWLQRDEDKLDVLERFDYGRKVTELRAKAKEAERKLERARATAIAEKTKLDGELASQRSQLALRQKDRDELLKQKSLCSITAQQAGIVAYANEEWWSSDRQIREGSIVHFRQKIFSLPDMTKMQVKVNVHESRIKRVKPGQSVTIRVDAFPNLTLRGTVKSVSQLADSNQSWMRGGVKEYTTIVNIDELPNEELKPGMTAETEILVSELADALQVPVQAVTERRREYFVYLAGNDQTFARQVVTIGDTNERFVEIKSGLVSGQVVALDARARAAAEMGGEDEQPIDVAPPTAPAARGTPMAGS